MPTLQYVKLQMGDYLNYKISPTSKRHVSM